MALTVVSLGSSFAAGPFLPPVVDADAGRSGRNYPHLLAARLDAELVDLTVSGATTATILDEPQTTITGKVYAPQIEGVPRNADVVTVTAGGNDLDYTGSMLFAAFRRLDPAHPANRMLAPRFPDGLREPSAETVAAAEAGLVRIVASVFERTESARVVLVDYLTVVGDGASGAALFDDAERDLLLATRTALEGAYERAADRSGAELLRVSDLSRDHCLDSPEPWITGLLAKPAVSAGSFHPNALGMERVAEALAGLLRT
jgi:lysophospholipase L1-like esterase